MKGIFYFFTLNFFICLYSTDDTIEKDDLEHKNKKDFDYLAVWVKKKRDILLEFEKRNYLKNKKHPIQKTKD